MQRPRSYRNPSETRLPPSPRAFATVGEEALVANRAGRLVAYVRDACGKQPFVGDRAQIDQASSAVSSREARVNLLADLVATWARAGAHQRQHLALATDLA